MDIKIPGDVLQSPSFRRLRDSMPVTAPDDSQNRRAVWIWLTLWLELAGLQAEGGQAGLIPKGMVDSFRLIWVDADPQGDVMDRLVEFQILIKNGDDYHCPRYASLNGGMTGYRSQAQRGGDAKRFKQKMAGLEHESMQMGLTLLDKRFVDGEGVPMDPDEAKRVMMLILGCDHALFKEQRQPFAFTPVLMANAATLLRSMTGEEISRGIELIGSRREHPLLAGMTTEKLLPQFGQFVRKL